MATKFPKFSQALAQDPATRRIWYGIATAHDLESHDGMTEESLYQKIFASHFGHLAIIFLWTSGNLFHVAWQGNFQQWVLNPLKVKPILMQFGILISDNLQLKHLHVVVFHIRLTSQLLVFITGGIQLECELILTFI
jgi:hypothetical protein